MDRCVFFRCVLLFCFFFFFFLVVPEITLAASPYLGAAYVSCMHNTTNGTALSSTFKQNLNAALQNLTNLSSKGTKYANISAGSGDDIVYTMFQCRGDQTTQLCSECVANATIRLPESDCPASIGARIQLDGCYLRYDNKSIFTPDFNYVIGFCYGKSSDATVLAAISSLVRNVTTQAPEQGGFASASASDVSEYAAAQCLGYLSKSECSSCLSSVPYRTVCDSTLGEQVHLTSCYYRFEPYSFFETPSPPPATAPPAAAPLITPAPATSSRGSKTIIIVIGIIAGALITIFILFAFMVWRRKANKITGEVGHVKLVERSESWSQSLMQTKSKVFSLQELEEATRHFHPDNKLGEGGYGPVYKGTLLSGEQVAIKKLASGSHQGKQEFLNEVTLITSVQHKNLIRLLGSCAEGLERVLVYEYLPNKSLDALLFGLRDDIILDWKSRYGILLGMAKGLAYLHEESHIRIIHRDIKPSNILLDNQLNPVIADFGLARLVKDDETHVSTRVAGTIGYLAPEYAIQGELSEKVDVFSFGIVCLEVITGKRNLNSRLLEEVWRLYLHNNILELIDIKLGNDFSLEQFMRIVHVALLCAEENPKQRPRMSTITLLLSGNSDILEIPNKPAFVTFSEPRVPIGTKNYPWSSTSSESSILHTHSSSNTHSHEISNATYSKSEILDAR